MLVMNTGSPLPSCDRLLGVVKGVKASFDRDGKGTSLRNDPGPLTQCPPICSSSSGPVPLSGPATASGSALLDG